MKLWNKENTLEKIYESFTIGRDQELDMRLAPYDVQGSIAHVHMLESVGLLTPDEKTILTQELNKILEDIHNDKFEIEEGVEDIHSQVEMLLTASLGDVGKKIHAGRSRNDQVLLDLRLYFRDVLEQFSLEIKEIIEAFITMSNKHADDLMPGLTHTQLGMVSSFGMWFGCYAEALVDDYHQLKFVEHTINQNPLGSAAGYGNSFPLDRQLTTDLLNFKTPCYNSMYAQYGRGKTELLIAQGLASCSYTISKFASDICLYNNQNFRFITLPDHMTTGSSIMPHKKNPDVFELMRARTNQLQTLPQQVSSICQNLTSGYHRDLQQLKEIIFDGIDQFELILNILRDAIPLINIKSDLLSDEKYNTLFSVEEVNKLVLEGISFRDAYLQVKAQIEDGTFHPEKKLAHTHIGSIGNLSNKKILEKL